MQHCDVNYWKWMKILFKEHVLNIFCDIECQKEKLSALLSLDNSVSGRTQK